MSGEEDSDVDQPVETQITTEMRKAVATRTVAKAGLTRISNYLVRNAQSELSDEELTVRLTNLQEMWTKYDGAQSYLEETDCGTHGGDRDSTEEKYLEMKIKFETLLKANRIRSQDSLPPLTPVNSSAQEDIVVKPKLPQINIPQFSGDYQHWRSFIELFDVMIHNNVQIPDVQKFFYLRNSLKGEAATIIESLSTTTANYSTARKLLNDRYNNLQVILNSHLKTIFELPVLTKESNIELRKLTTNVKQHMHAIEALKIATQNWDPIVIYTIKQKLDNSSKRQWEIENKDPTKLPTLIQFYEFLEKRCFALESLAVEKDNEKSKLKPSGAKLSTHVASSTFQNSCVLCKNNHNLSQCSQFINKPYSEKIDFIKSQKICFNCLRSGHHCKACRSRHCMKCDKYHHTLIHPSQANNTNTEAKNEITKATSSGGQIVSSGAALRSSMGAVILATAVINVQDARGNWIQCRALLDSGSQVHLITASLINKLHIKLMSCPVPISCINQTVTQANHAAFIKIKSRATDYETTIQCSTVPKVTIAQPTQNVNITEWQLPDLCFADPHFYTSREVDLLIGAEIYYDILIQEQIRIGPEMPILQNTVLGWVISGKVAKRKSRVTSSNNVNCHLATIQLSTDLERFWKIEEIDQTRLPTQEDEICEEYFKQTVSRDPEGKFVVRLPKRETHKLLGDSNAISLNRLNHIEKKMKSDSELQRQYSEFMTEYKTLEHMSEIPSTNSSPNIENYLPHHAVRKETSETTKLRVVFDASAKTSSGYSLNDILMTGPKLQSELIDILIRFRQHKYILSADIEKMYRMIWVHPDDRKLQRIFWRENPTEEIKSFELNTVTYGLACSPYLALRCLQQLTIEHDKNFPKASNVIKHDFFVDDMLTGSDDIEELEKIKQEVNAILKNGGFNLRKWRSNYGKPKVRETMPMFESTDITPTLGLRWDSDHDHIQYAVNDNTQVDYTKRQVLSQIAKLFDPLGLLSPVILQAKQLIQELWSQKLDWDEPLPDAVRKQWMLFKLELPTLRSLNIPRHVLSPTCINFQLHVFADASEKGYGAVIYVRSINMSTPHQTRILTAKSKVAPLKKLTLPRLELCAAVLAVRLFKIVRKSLTRQPEKSYFWSDSTIVLQWIQKDPSTLQTFVANRVVEIQAATDTSSWNHVPTHANPADFVSRGVNPKQFCTLNLWWNGPEFLTQNDDHWPKNPLPFDPDFNLEHKKKVTSHVIIKSDDIKLTERFLRFSSWSKLVRSFAYCLRFIQTLKTHTRESSIYLQPEEVRKSEMIIIRLVQQEVYKDEIQDLQLGKHVKQRSPLKLLNPFIDTEFAVIRVGGRLKQSLSLSVDQKHPIILPSHFVTDLILRHIHHKFGHCGADQLLAMARLHYWPLHGKSMTQKITRSCVICTRFQPIIPKYTMGDLPRNRIEQKRPFATSGIDYAGPIMLKESRRRGRVHKFKSYLAIFVCLRTKAVHLELVTSLTTECFLAALKRFVARRGLCTELYSDHGTNFVGAFNELRDIYKFLKEHQSVLEDRLSHMNIKWSFIPPRAPHFGGLWEAAVKSCKRHFYKITRNVIWTFEECYTLITQIEAILNSRPITVLSSDPNNLSYLCPSHFLIGDYLLEPATSSFSDVPDNKLSIYDHIQKVKEHFWKRWHLEYLHTLQNRVKWQSGTHDIERDSLVLLMEDNMAPLLWVMGKVIETHPGPDGISRVATVKTSTGVFKRPIKKLCKLPVE